MTPAKYFETHQTQLQAFVWRHVSTDRISDVLQETYLKVAHIPDCKNPYGYLCKTALSIIQHQNERPTPEPLIDDVPLPETPQSISHEVTSAISQLPKSLRDAITCVYVKDLSITETSESLHISTVAVRRRLSRGVARLRELLDTTTCVV
jgi:RNA polymerase sigma factor (sigma-70 family)